MSGTGNRAGADEAELLCPSAQPEMAEAVVFGVVGGTPQEPKLAYLMEPRAVTTELLALAGPVKATEVFRFAAPCAQHACQHFDGSRCSLIARVVQLLPTAGGALPPCRIRPKCRWWHEEGPRACARCPLIVTETYNPTELQQRAATARPVKTRGS